MRVAGCAGRRRWRWRAGAALLRRWLCRCYGGAAACIGADARCDVTPDPGSLVLAAHLCLCSRACAAAGYLFGPVKGTVIVSASSTLAAALAFLLARSSLRPLVEAALRGSGRRFASLDAALGADGARMVFLLRLSPLFPFSASNYLLGLTSVAFLPYVAATWAGALPGTFCYVFLGDTGRATAEAAAGGLPPLKLALYGKAIRCPQGPVPGHLTRHLCLAGVGAAATLAVTRAVSRAANAALQENTSSSSSDDDAAT